MYMFSANVYGYIYVCVAYSSSMNGFVAFYLNCGDVAVVVIIGIVVAVVVVNRAFNSKSL